jgi:hypothetical protein
VQYFILVHARNEEEDNQYDGKKCCKDTRFHEPANIFGRMEIGIIMR